jgi:hypothetical protein
VCAPRPANRAHFRDRCICRQVRSSNHHFRRSCKQSRSRPRAMSSENRLKILRCERCSVSLMRRVTRGRCRQQSCHVTDASGWCRRAAMASVRWRFRYSVAIESCIERLGELRTAAGAETLVGLYLDERYNWGAHTRRGILYSNLQCRPGWVAVASSAEIIIDEKGNLISGRAVSGHPLLNDEAVTAAHR